MNLSIIKAKAGKITAVIASLTILATSACNFANTPAVDNGNDTKDDSTIHAELDPGTDNPDTENTDKDGDKDGGDDKPEVKQPYDTENANNTGENLVEDDGTPEVLLAKGIDGYMDLSSKTFTTRAEGLYKCDDAYLEIYGVGNNLYGYYLEGDDSFGIEFFALGYEGFETKKNLSMSVKATFLVEDEGNITFKDYGLPEYYNMTLTDEGVSFKPEGNANMIKGDYVKLDSDMGYLEGFDYMNKASDLKKKMTKAKIETGEIPEDVIGSWIILGDSDTAYIIDLYDDGLAQVYFKELNKPVVLFRGSYAAGKNRINGAVNLYLDLCGLGYKDSDSLYNLCVNKVENDWLAVCEGDENNATSLFWEGATFIPFDVTTIPKAMHDEEALANYFSGILGTYEDEDGWILRIEEDNYYSFYNSKDFSTPGSFNEGSYETDGGGIKLYCLDYADTGNPDMFGYVMFMDQYNITVTRYDTQEIYEMKKVIR